MESEFDCVKKKRGNNTSDAEYAEKLAHKYLGTGIEILTTGNFDIYTENNNNFDKLIRLVANKNDSTMRELIKYEKKDDDI